MSMPIFSIKVNTTKLLAYAFAAFLLGSFLGGTLWNFAGIYTPSSNVLGGTFGTWMQFTSYDKMIDYLKESQGSNRHFWNNIFRPKSPFSLMGRGFVLESLSIEAGGSNDVAPSEISSGLLSGYDDFSTTNVQVEGVDEADIVKTDGTYIYVAKNHTVLIIKAYPAENSGIVYKLDVENPIMNLYISESKLVVFCQKYSMVMRDVMYNEYPSGLFKTIVKVYDIKDVTEPELERDFSIDGYYYNSRMIDEYVYFLVNYPAYILEGEINLPVIRDGKAWCQVEATDVYYPNCTENANNYNTLVALNINDPDEPTVAETFLLDYSSSLYVSYNNMYIVSESWGGNSTVTKIKIDDGTIEFIAEGIVPGYVLNQFSMDEFKGVFRIATTAWDKKQRVQTNNVYCLDEDMNIIGTLEGLAPNEDIYSARFMGDRLYLVTFQKVDPLFAIDLSEPENPHILGKLKIPGFSNYLHPYDENILIGIGKETIEAKSGDFAWHLGIKISLFHVEDVSNPQELAKIVIGDRGSDSPALADHKAVLFSKSRNLLVIPILEAVIDEDDYVEVSPSMYGDYDYQGAYVFDVSPDGIELRGRVTHIEDIEEFNKYGYWFETDYSVERSLYIYENLYTLSQNRLMINNLETLEELAVIDLK